VLLLHDLGLRPADLQRLTETRSEIFQMGIVTMRRKLRFFQEALGLRLVWLVGACSGLVEGPADQVSRVSAECGFCWLVYCLPYPTFVESVRPCVPSQPLLHLPSACSLLLISLTRTCMPRNHFATA